MSDHNLAEALPHFDDMTALQRRLHNAAIVLGADGDEYGFEGLLREAIVALAAREAWQQPLYTSPKLRALIDRVQAEQQAGEAVAVVYSISGQSRTEDAYATVQILNSAGKGCWDLPVRVGTKLFTRPQQPLTEEQIRLERKRIDPMAEDMDAWSFGQGVRFAERALGITKDTK